MALTQPSYPEKFSNINFLVGVAGVTSKLLPIYQLQVLQQTIFYVKKRNKRPFTKVKSNN